MDQETFPWHSKDYQEMNDIVLSKQKGWDIITFKKPMWPEGQVLAAKCFNFSYDVNTNTITAIIAKTNKRSLHEFMKLCFKNFCESPLEKSRRDGIYGQIKEIYDANERELEGKMSFILPYYSQLYEHQKEAIAWAYHKQFNFLALDPRLGKTLASTSLSLLWNCQRTLIVCPATAKYNAWFRGLKKFGFNELYFTILDSAKKYSLKAFNERYVIINYDILGKFMPELLKEKFDHVIFDEAQKIKSLKTQRTRHIFNLIKENFQAKITLLSGTPIKNRVDDIYSYLKLTRHELGKNKKTFLQQYTTQVNFRVTGGKNLDDLHIKLSNFIFRKRREDCQNLPKNNFLSYRFQLDDYKAEYDKIIEELANAKEMGAINGNIHSLNRVTALAKVKGVIDIANDILEQGRKVVIFGGYIDPLNNLETHFGKRCVKIDGSVAAGKRDQLIEKFTNDPKCDVFIGNSQSAAEAINLAAASDIIVLSFPFTPGKLRQLIDRCIEVGKKEDVTVHLTFTDDGIDEYIYEIITDKLEDINAVIDRGADIVYKENMREILISKLLKREIKLPNVPPGIEQIHENKITSQMVIIDQGELIVEKNDLPDFI